MTDLLQDVWHELREKRLWPIAVVLAIGVVAIPAVLTKSAAPADPVAAAPMPEDRAAVTLDAGGAASSGAGSTLDEFAKGNPFTPPAAIAKPKTDTTATAATATGPSDAGGGPGAGQGPVDGEPGPPSSDPGAPPIDLTPQPPQTHTETAEYEYVADVTLWTGDRRREIRGLRKLDMLPDQAAPVLIFMGTAEAGGNAVFLVDSTLKPAGEGTCVPSPANCAYLHLGPGSEHAFTTEAGDSYRIRVDEIRRVEVRAVPARKARPSARGASGTVRRFVLPSLADLTSVRTTETVSGKTGSSASRGSR